MRARDDVLDQGAGRDWILGANQPDDKQRFYRETDLTTPEYEFPVKRKPFLPKLYTNGTEIGYGTGAVRGGDYTFDGVWCKGRIKIRLGTSGTRTIANGGWGVSMPMPIDLSLGDTLATRIGGGTLAIYVAAQNPGHFQVGLHAGRFEDLTDKNAAYFLNQAQTGFGQGMAAGSSVSPFAPGATIGVNEWQDFHFDFEYVVDGFGL